MADLRVQVWLELAGRAVQVGDAWAHRRGSVESATFSYDPAYLSLPEAYALDPELPLVEGPLQTDAEHEIFGAFSDCAPDRWGRRLVARAERCEAKGERRTERSFGEVDYLLEARDDMRQGALRFRLPGEEAFLADEATGVPALVTLPSLLAAAERLERDEAVDEDIRALVKGGSSLGGARPKAHVINADGRPAIAKFPSPANDDWDVMSWEAVALKLADAAGIRVPRNQLIQVSGHGVLIVDRFDREGGRRLGYASAMTMLDATDGDPRTYLEIVEAIEAESASPRDDMRELWRRVAFSILVSNTDDHLRNHAFLRRSTAGWSLSPAFDMNPDPEPGAKHLSTAIESGATEALIETLAGVAEFFDLGADDVSSVLGEVLEATAAWRRVAHDLGLTEREIEEMSPAFETGQREAAAELVSPAAS
jgi:serine/threonine-protein kinase HipA